MTPRRPARYIAYLRVSTKKQGASGLGLEAQREAISQFLRGGRPAAEFIETESGKRNDRPQLEAAMREAKLTGARLLVAKLDRLSRNAAFLMKLRDAGLDFEACDLPNAGTLNVGIMATVAQHERELISERTRAALAAAKARGVKLGNPKGAEAIRHLGVARAVAGTRAKAAARAEDYRSLFRDLDPDGTRSARSLAIALNDRGIKPPREGSWQAITVQRLKARLASA